MAQITEIELNGTSYEIADVEARELALTNGCEYIVGTQSATTGSWTGVTTDAALYTGKKISYKLPQPGSGNASLTLTLADGSNTDAIPVYLGTTRMTTHFGMGSVIDMTYDGQYWRATAIPNSNNFDRINHNNALKAGSANATSLPYPIAANTPIGYVNAVGGYQSIVVGSVINLSKPILWATENVEASKTFTNSYEAYPSQSVRISFPSWTGTTYAMAYLKGSLQGTSFTVVELTCTEPSTENGYVYIPLGILYSKYQICFRTSSAMFAYLDGSFRQISSSEILSSLNSRLSQAESDIDLRVTKNELDTRTTDTDMWLRRVTPGKGIATIKSIKGNTVRWNQLAPAYDSENWTQWNTYVIASSAGGELVLTSNTDASYMKAVKGPVQPEPSHTFLFKVDIDASYLSSDVNAIFGIVNSAGSSARTITAAGGTAKTSYSLIGAIGSATYYVVCRVSNTTAKDEYATFSNMQCFDLTQIFGAGNEPSTVAEFQALYPASYYPYDPSSLKSVDISGLKSIGFNAWDEELETGSINTETGINNDSANVQTNTRSKNYIPINSTLQYCFKNPAPSGTSRMFFYDDNYQFLSEVTTLANNGTKVITPTATAAYARFGMSTSYGTIYNNDICFNVSDQSRNGEYKPHIEQTLPLSLVLRSAGDAYDELTETKVITRIASANLGDRIWNAYSSGAGNTYYCNLSGSIPVKADGQSNLTSVEHALGTSASALVDGEMIGGSTNNRVYIRDDSCSTEDAMKAARAGEIIYYEMAEPTTTSLDPSLNLTYRCEAGGTETFIVPEGHISAPPITEISYGVNAMDGIADSLARISKAESNINNMSDHFWEDSDNSYIGKNNQAHMTVLDNSVITTDINDTEYMKLSKKGIMTTVNFSNEMIDSNVNYTDTQILALTKYFNESAFSILNNEISINGTETGYFITPGNSSDVYYIIDQNNNKVYNDNFDFIEYYPNNSAGNKFIAVESDILYPMATTYDPPVTIEAGGVSISFQNKKLEIDQPLPISSGGTGINDYGTIINNDISDVISVPNNTNKSIGLITLSKGTWLVRYCAKFATDGTGRRQATFGTTADNITATWQRYCGSQTPATVGGASILNGSIIRTVASSEILYLTVFQTSGGALDVSGNIQAFKLK